MHLLLRSLSASLRHTYHHPCQQRGYYDAATSINWVRDRGLDHAVLREKNLKPVLNLKNLIKAEPSKSLPLSIITESKNLLRIPTRPIELIRKYPLIFEEYFPGNIAIHPHIRLTAEALELDAEENLFYESVNYKQDLADRLLKLLMIGRINKIPLSVLDNLKWELGLPQNFVECIVPDFPDYFAVKKGNLSGSDGMLELVCWTDELAISVMEKRWEKMRVEMESKMTKKDEEKKGVAGVALGKRRTRGEGKQVPFEFSLSYTRGFEMDKKYKTWVDEWQKLPYVSPYENALQLTPKSDESDKWAVAVLHEILNLFVGKKGEKEAILNFGEYLGLRSRFKRAMLQHPGIFYVSSKNRMHTVVLRDGYKRGALIERHPLMEMRFKYAHLMNIVKEGDKATALRQKDGEKPKKELGEEIENVESDEEDDEEYVQSDEETESDEEDYHGVNAKNRGRSSNEAKFAGKWISRGTVRSSAGAQGSKLGDKRSQGIFRKSEHRGDNIRGRSQDNLDVPKHRVRSKRDRNTSVERRVSRLQMQHMK